MKWLKNKRKLEILEKQYHEELKMEIEGNTFSNLSNKKADNPPHAVDEDDAEEANDRVDDLVKQAEKEDNDISVSLMSRKKRGLYRAIQISKERKRSRVELLRERKKRPNPALPLIFADARNEIHEAGCLYLFRYDFTGPGVAFCVCIVALT